MYPRRILQKTARNGIGEWCPASPCPVPDAPPIRVGISSLVRAGQGSTGRFLLSNVWVFSPHRVGSRTRAPYSGSDCLFRGVKSRRFAGFPGRKPYASMRGRRRGVREAVVMAGRCRGKGAGVGVFLKSLFHHFLRRTCPTSSITRAYNQVASSVPVG